MYKVIATDIDPRSMYSTAESIEHYEQYSDAHAQADTLAALGYWTSIYAESGECIAEFPNASEGEFPR